MTRLHIFLPGCPAMPRLPVLPAFIGFSVLCLSPAAHAQNINNVSAILGGGSLFKYGNLNVSSGVFTSIASQSHAYGMGYTSHNSLYTFVDSGANRVLESINPDTGASALGPSVAGYEITSDGQTLYSLRSVDDPGGLAYGLSTVNTSTGATTPVVTYFAPANTSLDTSGFQDFAFHNNALYVLGSQNGVSGTFLYNVNTSTGAVTQVGSNPMAAGINFSTIFDTPGALYAYQTNGSFLYKVDLTTGSATQQPNSVTSSDTGVGLIEGASYRPADAATPEPGSLALFAGLAVSGVVAARRRRK